MRTSFSKLSLLALPLAALTACQDYEPFDEATVHTAMAAREFTNNFEERYGKIDPNHNWGFENLEPFTSDNTRASVDVNLNQWKDKYGNIPGYPFINGKYRVQSETNQPVQEFASVNGYDPNEYELPAGDVTDHEIKIVSEWFRTHKEGTPEFEAAKVSLNISEFFVQNVSKDKDRVDNNQGDQLTILNDSRPGHTGTEQATFGMDKLVCKEAGKGSEKYDPTQGWTDINNFNAGNTNFIPNDYNSIPDYPSSQYFSYRELKLVTSGGTSDFACIVSLCDDEIEADKMTYDWVLVRLAWKETINNVEYDREGYYLAFDYSAHKNSADFQYYRDGYYNNWIVKITPAYYKESPKTKRVMCEDLGNTFDFDFNDVVFDVAFEETNGAIDAVITLQAAGGTMPIYVGVNPSVDDSFESHQLLGKHSSDTPINVSGTVSEVSSYRIKRFANAGAQNLNADDITVYVKNTKDDQIYSIAAANRGNLSAHDGSNGYNNGDKLSVGTTGASMAPQKFAVGVGTRWMKESQQIETAYHFEDWVRDSNYAPNGNAWYHNDNIISTANLWPGPGYTGEPAGGTPTGGGAQGATRQIEVVTYNPEMGSVTITGTGTYSVGDEVTVTATPSGSNVFAYWRYEGSEVNLSTDNPYTFTVTTSTQSKIVGYFTTGGSSTPAASNFALTSSSANISLTAVGTNASAEVGYTTSSDGALSFSYDSDKMTVSYNAGTKKITITTNQVLTNETITVTQAATNAYQASDGKTITVNSSVSTPGSYSFDLSATLTNDNQEYNFSNDQVSLIENAITAGKSTMKVTMSSVNAGSLQLLGSYSSNLGQINVNSNTSSVEFSIDLSILQIGNGEKIGKLKNTSYNGNVITLTKVEMIS